MIDGDDLKAMRLNAGISQQGMSKKLDCDRRTIHNYELGVSDIPSARLFQWFKYCKLDISVLLNQIKAVRGEASKNGTSKLLDVISVLFITSALLNVTLTTTFYLILLISCTGYGLYKKNINISHISGFIFIFTAIPTIIFEVGLISYFIDNASKLLKGIVIYGIQLLFSIITASILLFRVQVSRAFSHSKSVQLTQFDGIFHWIYLLTSIIYLLSLLEYFVKVHFAMLSWTIIYDHFEVLIYSTWVLNCATLLAMMLTSAEPEKKQ